MKFEFHPLYTHRRKGWRLWTRIRLRARRNRPGKVKEATGKVTGDAKLESEGKADTAAGKIRNAIGGIKDTLRGK
jgi:uncharacterized protein YjbJ (UPF0337 family)